MRIKPAVASVVGPTTQTQWGQVFLSPTAYGVVEISDPGGASREHGIQVLSRMSQELLEAPTSLEAVANVARQIWNDRLVSLVIFVPVGRVVYVVLTGEGMVLLRRADNISSLLASAGSASGETEEGDTFLLVSRGFSRAVPIEALQSVFDHLPPADVSEKLTLLLHEAPGAEGSAGLVFSVEKLIAVEEEEAEARVSTVAQPQLSGTQTVPVLSQIPHRHSLQRVARGMRRVRQYFLEVKQRPRTLRSAIAVVLVFLFCASVVVGVLRQRNQKNNQAITTAVSEAQRLFDEGMALLPLNAVKGREQITRAKGILEPLARTTSDRTREGRQVRILYQQVSDNLTQAMQITRVVPSLFYDPGFLKKDAKATAIALIDDTLAMLDGPGKTSYLMTISSKNGQIIAGGEGFANAAAIAIHGERVFTLADSGVHLTRVSDKKTTIDMIKRSNQWGIVPSLVSYGGNLYLLDRQKSRIWKYLATESGFSDIREYLNPDTLPNFANATTMAIDGSVWVGTSDGKILRFTQGKENTFTPQGVEPAFGATLVVYTSDELASIYVLDQEKSRVVVLDKDGMYLAQYVWDPPFAPAGLVVSEKQKKILLLAEGKLFVLDLK